MSDNFFSKTLLPLIHYKLIFTKRNLLIGLWMIPVALFDFIILVLLRFFSGANSGSSYETASYSLFFVIFHVAILGVWTKYFINNKLGLDIRDSLFVTGMKVFGASFIIMIAFSIASFLINFIRYILMSLIISVGSMIPLLGVIFMPMGYLLTMMFSLASIAIAVAGFIFPSGRAISFLYEKKEFD